MPNLLPAVDRFSQFLQQETERKRRFKNEQILRQLPSIVEKQFSSITSEKDVYPTLSRITGELYKYGPEVGQIATQIATQYAQGKLNELQTSRLESKRNEQKEAFLGLYKDVKISDDKGGTTTIGQKYGSSKFEPETFREIITGEVNLNALTPKHTVTERGTNQYITRYNYNKFGEIVGQPTEGQGDPKTGLVDFTPDIKGDETRLPEYDIFLQKKIDEEEQRKIMKELRYISSGSDQPNLRNVLFKDNTKGMIEIKSDKKKGTYYENVDTKEDVTSKVERFLGTGLYDDSLSPTDITQTGTEKNLYLGQLGKEVELNDTYSTYLPTRMKLRNYNGYFNESAIEYVYNKLIKRVDDHKYYKKLLDKTITDKEIDSLPEDELDQTDKSYLKTFVKFKTTQSKQFNQLEQYNNQSGNTLYTPR